MRLAINCGFAPFSASVFCWCLFAVTGQVIGQIQFSDVTIQSGILHQHSDSFKAYPEVGGVSVADYDNDGWPDLFFPLLDGSDLLYRNNGDGTFTDVSIAAGFTVNYRSNGSAWGDIDNDGDLDLYVITADELKNYLYINMGDGTFTEQGGPRNAAIDTGIPRKGYGVAMGDYDRDGYLDIMTTDYGKLAVDSQSRLLRNLGSSNPGYFEDVTAQTGLDVYRGAVTLRFTPQFTDLDQDGHTDIVMVSDLESSQLFWNNGDNTFTDGTVAASVGTDEAGMGSALADFDGDGDLDWFVTAIFPHIEPYYEIWTGNRLYRNDGNRQFTDVTESSGVLVSGWAWGTVPIDFDNDGDNDLAATNGWVIWPAFANDPTAIWENDGSGSFTEVTNDLGLTDDRQGRGLVQFDFDKDGDLDLLVANYNDRPTLLRNDGGNQNNHLRINLTGRQSNRNGIGAFITITPDSSQPTQTMCWEVRVGDGYSGHSETTAHFGLGKTSTIDEIEILWPTGIVQRIHDVVANNELNLREPWSVLPQSIQGAPPPDSPDN